MQPIIMQDWITIRGQSNNPATTVTMSQSSWLNTAPFQDVTFFLDVREFTGTTVTLTFETSPGRDEVLFQACVAAFTLVTGTAVKNCFLTTATVPVSNWTRWKLAGPQSVLWDATFRVMAAGNSIC